MRKLLPITLLTVLAPALFIGCRNENGSRPRLQVESIMACDSLPMPVKKLVMSVNEGDSVAFAALVSYPLERPYPLRDIASADVMKGYYSTLVDDSLRQVILCSPVDEWSEAGWRGWTVANGQYLWIDNDLYEVAYVSAREMARIDSLTKMDLLTLPKALREGWKPEACYIADNGTVYRIDRSVAERAEPYRLSIYNTHPKAQSDPSEIHYGTMLMEGSAGTAVYSFGEKGGRAVLIEPYLADGEGQRVTISVPGGDETTHHLQKCYWLDIVD